MEFEHMLREIRVIPVVEIPRVEDAIPLARTLAENGLPCAEITFRTAAAGAAIAAITDAVPGFTVGAGTVVSVRQAEEAVAAGASFLVCPGFDDAVVAYGRDCNVAVLPGVCTPSEIMRAIAAGLDLVKFFPAEAAGGVGYLKAVAAPFGAMRFVPTGGIAPSNVDAYLRHPQVVACGGSWMVKRQAIADGDFATIGRLTAEAVMLATAADG